MKEIFLSQIFGNGMFITFIIIVIVLVIIAIIFAQNDKKSNSDIYKILSEKQSYIDKYVSCHECLCLLEKQNARVVKAAGGIFKKMYFCNIHKKPYSIIIYTGFYDQKPKYYGEVEMLPDGTPVGYTKNKK